jgi:hypothetical protein
MVNKSHASESDLIRALIPLEECIRRVRRNAASLIKDPRKLRVAIDLMNDAEALTLSAAIAASRARSFAKDAVSQGSGGECA